MRKEEEEEESLTWFPLDFIISISSGVNVAIVIDFTLCGGVNPLLQMKKEKKTIIRKRRGKKVVGH